MTLTRLPAERGSPKPPPENPEAEASLLGAAMLDAHVYQEFVRGRIGPADLSREQHRIVLRGIEALAGRGETIGFASVQAELQRSDELAAVGGPQFLVGLMQDVPTVAHAETYVTIVERTALLRRLIGTANEIARIALVRDAANDAVEEAQRLLFGVSESTLHRDIVPLDVALRRYAEQITARGDEQPAGIPTGLATLDAKTGGLQASDLIILAGRPGLGKTSLALCIVEHAALVTGRVTAMFSLEMSEMQVVQRLVSMNAQIDGTRIRRGRLGMDELQAINDASARLQQAPIFVEESSRLTVTDILAKARRLQAERGLDLVVVDYLQLIEGADDEENRVQEVAKISRSLKAVARELQIPVVALSQLSRQIETRGTEPMLSDLRECVTGDTQVIDGNGETRDVADLKAGANVLAVSRDGVLRPFAVADVWRTGVKAVYRVSSRSGRAIRATANHPFLTRYGWRSLETLRAGDVIAMRPGSVLAGAPGRARYGSITTVARADAPTRIAWDLIDEISPDGIDEVFDLRVPGSGNFLANGFVVHNSGALEQDADLVLFLWQKDLQDRRDGVVRLKLAKHRNGPTADIDLHFEREVTRFRDLGESHVEATR